MLSGQVLRDWAWPGAGLLTWSEIWCDVENSKSFRSSRDRRIFAGHRLKAASALHNFLASIFTAPGVTTWSDMSGNTRKIQVTRLVTLRHRSTMSGALWIRPIEWLDRNPWGDVHDDAVTSTLTAPDGWTCSPGT